MSKNLFIGNKAKEKYEYKSATIYSISSYRARLIFPGETEPTTKLYKCPSGFHVGQKVYLAKVGGTFTLIANIKP